jgi:hypothetical protein
MYQKLENWEVWGNPKKNGPEMIRDHGNGHPENDF